MREAVRRNRTLVKAASRLYTSQPGVSKQIKELNMEIFVRWGKRLIALTEPVKLVIKVVERTALVVPYNGVETTCL